MQEGITPKACTPRHGPRMPVPNPQPSNIPQPSPIIAFRARLVAGVILLNVLVAGICWYSLHQSRIHAADRAVLTTQNLAKILDENMNGIVAKVDIAMLAVVDEAERQLAAGGIQQAVLTSFIVREHARIPEVEVFRATGASGDAVYGPQAMAATTTSLAHRDYFRQLKGDPGAGLVLSKPLVGGISGKWMVVLARRINGPGGAFAGLVYTGVTIEHLTRGFASFDIGPRGTMALVDSDATLVARYPTGGDSGQWVGRKLSSNHLNQALEGSLTTHVYTTFSTVDAVERTIAVRRLGLPRPLFITVGLATRDYLSEWRLEAWKLSSFALIFLCLTMGAAITIHRGWRRRNMEAEQREAARALLAQQKEELADTLARTKRLEGFISICMHCKKINNKQDSWEQMEKYISEHSDAQFSHGICPDCIQMHHPLVHRKQED